MDPITTAIVAALAALSKDAIKDGYNALKSTLKKKFGSESDLVDAVEKWKRSRIPRVVRRWYRKKLKQLRLMMILKLYD